MAYGKSRPRARRAKVSRRSSRKNFRKGSKTKKLNVAKRPMRGGWRI